MLKGESTAGGPSDDRGESYDVFAGLKAEQQRNLTEIEQEHAEQAGRYIVASALENGQTWVTVKSLQVEGLIRSAVKGAQHEWDKQNGGDGTGRNLQTAGMQVVGLNRIPQQSGKRGEFIERLKHMQPSLSGKRLILLYDLDQILKFDQQTELKDTIFDLITNQKDITWVVFSPNQPRDLSGIESTPYADFVRSTQWGVILDNEGAKKGISDPVIRQQESVRPLPADLVDNSGHDGRGSNKDINQQIT